MKDVWLSSLVDVILNSFYGYFNDIVFLVFFIVIQLEFIIVYIVKGLMGFGFIIVDSFGGGG